MAKELHENGFIKLHRVCKKQIFADLLRVVELKQLAIKLAVKQVDNQLASSLLTTCSRLVIIKPEQAMRTHRHIGLTMLQRN